jgi:hypothetical protein
MVGQYQRRLRRERVNYCRKDLNPGITYPEFCYTTRTFVFGHDREQVVIMLSGGSLVNFEA